MIETSLYTVRYDIPTVDILGNLYFAGFSIFLPPELLRSFYTRAVPFANQSNIFMKPRHGTESAIRF